MRDWAECRRKADSEPGCRVCGSYRVDPHHIVYRSLGGDDHPDNIMALCRRCHDLVHAKTLDLLPLCSRQEQGHAAGLLGIESARRLLAPSVIRDERTRADRFFEQEAA